MVISPSNPENQPNLAFQQPGDHFKIADQVLNL